MAELPISKTPRFVLAALLFAGAQVAIAQKSTTPATLGPESGPCGTATPAGPGMRSSRFGYGSENPLGLELGADLAPLGMLNLNANQRTRINAIQRGLCVTHYDLASRIAVNKAELRRLYAADQRDAPAIDRQYENLFALQRQAIEADIDAFERIMNELTAEQRAALTQFRPGPAGIVPVVDPKSRDDDANGAGK